MAEWNDPPRAGEQQQNQKLTKEEVISCLRMQLWSMGVTCLQHKLHPPARVEMWPCGTRGSQHCCCEAESSLLSLAHSSSGCVWGCCSPAVPQLPLALSTHLCPYQAKSALGDFVGWELGKRPGSQFTVRIWSRYGGPATPDPHRRWEPAEWRRRQPQAALVVDFLTLRMHVLMCSMFSLNILLSVPLIIHLLVITVPISKYREINKNT